MPAHLVWRPQGDCSAHPWASPLRGQRRYAPLSRIAPGDPGRTRGFESRRIRDANRKAPLKGGAFLFALASPRVYPAIPTLRAITHLDLGENHRREARPRT